MLVANWAIMADHILDMLAIGCLHLIVGIVKQGLEVAAFQTREKGCLLLRQRQAAV